MSTEHIVNAQKAEQLTSAFQIFNELSEHLVISYQGLEGQVAKLHQELAFARSDRLKTLEEKEQLAARLQKILSALPAGVIVLDSDGLVFECNAVAVSLLGEPLRGQSWQQIANRSLVPVFGNPHEQSLTNGTRLNISYRQLEANTGQIILLSDVTEMRALQDLLNQQKQLTAMGEMVASMAHQVRTPLATAILYASQLTNPAIDSQKRLLFSQKILERLHHLEQQVNDMLGFAKQGRLQMNTFSLTSLLSQLRTGAMEYATTKPIDVSITNTVQQDELLGNANALRGALLNIIHNAVDALDPYGAIQIMATQNENNLLLVIADDGAGIPESFCERIFEPFFTTKSSGTGLGLSVVDSVVKAHNGAVSVESKTGLGTVFTISLPCFISASYGLPSGQSDSSAQVWEMQYETV